MIEMLSYAVYRGIAAGKRECPNGLEHGWWQVKGCRQKLPFVQTGVLPLVCRMPLEDVKSWLSDLEDEDAGNIERKERRSKERTHDQIENTCLKIATV